MNKGISSLLALLIVITIVIGVAIVASGIISDFLVKQRPKGGDLVLASFAWWYEWVGGDEYVIHVEGSATNIGSECINITRVAAVVNNVEYDLRFYEVNNPKPNSIAEIIASGRAPLPNSNILNYSC